MMGFYTTPNKEKMNSINITLQGEIARNIWQFYCNFFNIITILFEAQNFGDKQRKY
mgnify:CR=1 FL=1